MTTHKTANVSGITSVIAREEDGNIQITFTIPFAVIQKAQEETVEEMAKDVEIPGFRKGTAPISKVREKLSQSAVVEHSLSHILPKALSDAVADNKLRIAVYPRFELVSAKENEAWQIKGVTCELPEFSLGDYKKVAGGALRADSIVVPGKENKEKSREEKEGLVLKALIDSVKIKIPRILVEEEADSRLSSLLARLEKLGLALESYLGSINKKAEDLRAEYAVQAKDAISVDLILNKIAEEENLKVDAKEVDSAMQMSQASKDDHEDPENRKRLIESILKRRKALDHLVSLA
ncbi:MAG TPA: trigger factor [Patescibacteria group bacterium]|nr:trigger factor [Patescibacteria group bacterium]